MDIFQIDPRELFFYTDTLQSTQLSVTSIGNQQLNRDLINSLQNDRTIRFENHSEFICLLSFLPFVSILNKLMLLLQCMLDEFDRSIDSTLPTDWKIQSVQNHTQTAAMMETRVNNQTEYSENQFMLDEFHRSADTTLSTYWNQSVQGHTQTAAMMETEDETEDETDEPRRKQRVYLFLIDLINEPSKHGSYGWLEWVNKQAGTFIM